MQDPLDKTWWFEAPDGTHYGPYSKEENAQAAADNYWAFLHTAGAHEQNVPKR